MRFFLRVLIFIVFFILANIQAADASILFQDSFIGGISPTAWTPITSNNFGLFFINTNFGIKDTSSLGQYTYLTTNNNLYNNDNEINLDVKISNNDPSSFNIFCRINFISTSLVGAQFYPSGGGNTLDTLNGSDFVNYSWDNSNGIHHFKVICDGHRITINEDGNNIYNDSAHFYQLGSTNQAAIIFGDGHSSEFANFKFCDVNGCTSNQDISLSVPLLMQTASPWGTQEYDSAHNWSPNSQSIGSWGCALTSATMVLNYHGLTKLPDGQSLNPGTLNSWLKSQSDGYVGNGLLNWLAIQRLSRKAKQSGNNPGFAFDALEYKRVNNADKNTLLADLQGNRPDILEEPGHFIVGKGTQGSTFSINDPFYNNRPTLNDGYSNTFLSLGRYIPSHTNLSYMLFVTDPNATLKLKTASGSAVGESYIQSPLQSDDNNIQTSGDSTQLLYFPQPEDGMYTLSISSPSGSEYHVGTYLYDVNGEVKEVSLDGFIPPLGTDSAAVNFSPSNQNSQTITKQSTITSTLQDLDFLFQKGFINKGIYSSIKSLLQNAQKDEDKHNIFVAKIHLGVIELLLKLPNSLVSKTAQTILQEDVFSLLSQI